MGEVEFEFPLRGYIFGGSSGFGAFFHPFALLLIVHNHLIMAVQPVSGDCKTLERGTGGGEGINILITAVKVGLAVARRSPGAAPGKSASKA